MAATEARASCLPPLPLAGRCLSDIPSTTAAGTARKKASQLLLDRGAKCVYACIAHGVLSGPALQRLADDRALSKLCITDSIQPACLELIASGKVEVVSAAPIIAVAIDAMVHDRSLSAASRTAAAAATDGEAAAVPRL